MKASNCFIGSLGATILLSSTVVLAAGFDLTWNTIDGGGATSTGGGFELSGTIGQADASAASALTGGNYTLVGGFWPAFTSLTCTQFAPADFNQDCSVDTQDLAIFEACASGPAIPYNPAALPPGCTLTPDGSEHIAADFNGDGSVDQSDFGIFQRCYGGPGKAADPNCAN
jgi:hypothetical protein